MEAAWNRVRRIIFQGATELQRMQKEDAWWNEEMKQVVGEKRYNVQREKRIVAENIVKQSKEQLKQGEKLQSSFDGSKKLFWKWMKNAKQVSSQN